MTTAFFSAAFFSGMMLIVSGASLFTTCQIPSDLNIHYEKVTDATLGMKFLMPAEYMPSTSNKTLYRGETTCPRTLPTSGEMRDRSSCPWYTTVITDSTLFPSIRTEAVCRCQNCIGSDGIHNCESVVSEMLFLQRTSLCIDGLFVYTPIRKSVPIGCVCAKKKIVRNIPYGYRNYDY